MRVDPAVGQPLVQHPFGGAAAAAAVDRYILQLVVLYYVLLCVGGVAWWGETSLLPPGRHGMDAQGRVETRPGRVDGCPPALSFPGVTAAGRPMSLFRPVHI